MTSKWGNADDEKVSDIEKTDYYCEALRLCQDLTSVIIANNPSPAAAAHAIAIMFGVAYRVACYNKIGEQKDVDIFNQMVEIALAIDNEFEEWKCQDEKAETKDGEAN